jgi:hypothetical protein
MTADVTDDSIGRLMQQQEEEVVVSPLLPEHRSVVEDGVNDVCQRDDDENPGECYNLRRRRVHRLPLPSVSEVGERGEQIEFSTNSEAEVNRSESHSQGYQRNPNIIIEERSRVRPRSEGETSAGHKLIVNGKTVSVLRDI